MKNLYALAIAAALGLAGLLCNLAYLNMKTRDIEKIEFIGIAPKDSTGRERRIAPGQKLRPEDLVPVPIPARWAGNLDEFAYLYSGISGVVDRAPSRELRGGRLLLRTDMATPPERLELGEDEVALGVPIDMRRFVPALAVPGNMVSFTVSGAVSPLPQPAVGEETGAGLEPVAEAPNRLPAISGPVDVIGPFRILSLGNRLGSADIWKGSRAPLVQENVLMVAAKMREGQLEAKAQKLLGILESSSFRGVGVILHPTPSAPVSPAGTP